MTGYVVNDMTGKFTLAVFTDVSTPGGQATRATWAQLRAEFATVADATTFVATLPKRLRIKASTISDGRGNTWGYASGSVSLNADGANKGINETGLARLRAWVKVLNPTTMHDDNVCINYATTEQVAHLLATGNII
jgi:hypothetical protein